jgi:hypothetical protein
MKQPKDFLGAGVQCPLASFGTSRQVQILVVRFGKALPAHFQQIKYGT